MDRDRSIAPGYCQELLPLGVVEGQPEHLPIATSLNQPKRNGEIITRMPETHRVANCSPSGSKIGMSTAVDDVQVQEPYPESFESVSRIGEGDLGEVHCPSICSLSLMQLKVYTRNP